MDTTTNTAPLDLETRLRRSQGRTARKFSATAKLTRPELQELERQATARAMTLSEWAREVLLREARSTGTDAVFTELVALRMMFNSLLRPLCCGQTLTPDDFSGQMESIRVTKHKVAKDVLAQYAARER